MIDYDAIPEGRVISQAEARGLLKALKRLVVADNVNLDPGTTQYRGLIADARAVIDEVHPDFLSRPHARLTANRERRPARCG